jgi:uncharacterized protein (TIGR00251 family)
LPESPPIPCHWRRPGLLVCRLRIVPRAPRSELVGVQGDRLKLRLCAPPVDGRANAELIVLLARLFGVPRGRVRLTAGLRGRNKTAEIESPGVLPDFVQHQLDLHA